MPLGPPLPNPWAIAPMQVAPFQEAVPVTAPVTAPFPAADTIPPPPPLPLHSVLRLKCNCSSDAGSHMPLIVRAFHLLCLLLRQQQPPPPLPPAPPPPSPPPQYSPTVAERSGSRGIGIHHAGAELGRRRATVE